MSEHDQPCPHPEIYDRGECCGGTCFRDRDAAPREREAVEAEGQQPGPEQSEGIAND